ncbi:MAG: histidine phosphatase family protein [Alphaproteobacteria bacterium]|nr:histidine phosphatase family protein [Rhodobiaceae bacterium]MBO6544209.1 histidine phosphatase family protein [Alphaproteobacteria bacterium]MBO6627677.1 histidine phosphatase family protein [Alphaproteobacteria bacterium]MDF1627459.1 histidine phosphatase family protein [Parvibaculaceae bacterium]
MNETPLLIDILRHGETPLSGRFCGHSDPELTDLGWEQMRLQTVDGHWNRIVTSPLRRCAAFAQSLSSSAQMEPLFQEMYFGAWEGRTAEDIWAEDAALLEAFWRDPDTHPTPGGERWRDFQARVDTGFHALSPSECENRGPLLLVTHAGVMRALLISQLGLSFSAAWKVALPLGAMMRFCLTKDKERGQVHTQLLSLKGPS